MSSSIADFVRFSLQIERLLDADLLRAEEGAPILSEIAAACQSLGNGDTAAAHRHTAQSVWLIEALVQAGRLDAAYGRETLEAAHRLLNDPAG